MESSGPWTIDLKQMFVMQSASEMEAQYHDPPQLAPLEQPKMLV